MLINISAEFYLISWLYRHHKNAQKYLTYIPTKLVITEAIEIKVRGSKEDFQDVDHYYKILEDLALVVTEGLHDPDHRHGDVGGEEHEGHHE